VLNRTVSNSLIDLEDTLDGKGRPQSGAWVPTAPVAVDVASPDGVAREGAERPRENQTMVTLVEKITDHMQKGLSRRGFLAFAGKVVAVTGMVMVGADRLALTVGAQSGCCPTPRCSGCPTTPPAACPSGCVAIGQNYCCDTGGTNTCHSCVSCLCSGIPNCVCELDLGTACATPPCQP
jgi:hypothetical protein